MTAKPSPPPSRQRLDRLIRALSGLREQALTLEREHAADLARVPAGQRPSARNLLHYLALRQHELRDLQRDLSDLGLSSLGRCEANVLAALDAPLAALRALAGRQPGATGGRPPVDQRSGPATLVRHARTLLGRSPAKRAVTIMVTLPSEAATDYALVRGLLAAGMNQARINSAHDRAKDWRRMIALVRRAGRELKRECRVMVDLAGPKLRTGPLVPGPQVMHWRPQHDEFGRVEAPARIALFAAGGDRPTADADAALPVAAAFLRRVRGGDLIRLVDVRGKRRILRIAERIGDGWVAEGGDSAYVAPGTALRLLRQRSVIAEIRLGPLPPREQPLRLRRGDILLITAGDEPGRPARLAADGTVSGPARISCTLPEALAQVRVGERIWFDDGKIGGIVRRTGVGGTGTLAVEITQAPADGAKLRADKGINLPDSDLVLPTLDAEDHATLAFAAAHADLIGLSFVRSPADVVAVERALTAIGGRRRLGLVLKIETPQGFADLPQILLAGLRSPPLGVMVARGDLAVEVGFGRLAEVQEEILWLCEAAHVPVIWGTQVLESLAKKGMPSRAEVTDAAMSGRAECVMLNKGPHVLEAVRFLDDVLARMRSHQTKKRALLRRLAVSQLR